MMRWILSTSWKEWSCISGRLNLDIIIATSILKMTNGWSSMILISSILIVLRLMPNVLEELIVTILIMIGAGWKGIWIILRTPTFWSMRRSRKSRSLFWRLKTSRRWNRSSNCLMSKLKKILFRLSWTSLNSSFLKICISKFIRTTSSSCWKNIFIRRSSLNLWTI